MLTATWNLRGIIAGLFGAYLLAIYDPDGETFQTISKLGTGFSEEKLVVRVGRTSFFDYGVALATAGPVPGGIFGGGFAFALYVANNEM